MKNFAGISGAARIYQLNRAALTRAELHGKRLDITSKSRAINGQPPLTTTGLELNKLFEWHVDDAFVPVAGSKAMHILIQFPKDLVDGDDAAGMLTHARAFTRRVFGDAAIFADRVDRDEKSRHVVDLFVAPKYLKTTKHQEKIAVGMTHHLKALAEKYGEKTGPHGCGRALQTALFEYLRDEMGLTGVQRGSPKQVPGPDWKSAEQMRVEELDAQRSELAKSLAEVAQRTALLDANEVEQDRRNHDLAERERQALERERKIAENETKLEIELEKARVATHDNDQAQMMLNDALQVAQRNADESSRISAAAKKEVADAEADRARLALERDAVVAEGKRINDKRKLEQAQFELLVRGADEKAGLELRRSGDTFAMRKEAMRPDELEPYKAPWSATLVKIARQLAEALERVRGIVESLLQRERQLEAQATALTAREQEADRQRRVQESKHAAALAELERRGREVDARERAISERASVAEKRFTAAQALAADAGKKEGQLGRWVRLVSQIVDHPEWIDQSSEQLKLTHHAETTIDPSLVAVMREQPPLWAENVILSRLLVGFRENDVEKLEAEVGQSARQLAELVSRAGPILTPDQKAVAVEAEAAVKRSATASRAWNTARGVER